MNNINLQNEITNIKNAFTVLKTHFSALFSTITTKLVSLRLHISQWSEIYVVIPIVVVSIILAAKFVFYLTGRAPTDDVSAVAGLAMRCLAVAAVIGLTTLTKQALDSWISEEAKKVPAFQYADKIENALIFITIAYILLH